MRQFDFNAEMAKANVDEYNNQMFQKVMKTATDTTERFLETIKRDSVLGREFVKLQSSATGEVNSIIRNQLRNLGFKVELNGNTFEISWKREV